MSTTLKRRSLLRGLGAGLLAPFAGMAGRLESSSAEVPDIKRLLIFNSKSGTVYDEWRLPVNVAPGATSAPLRPLTASQFSTILRPLWPHRASLVIVDNLDMGTYGNGGHSGPAYNHVGWGAPNMVRGSGSVAASIDQKFANLVRKFTPVPSLTWGDNRAFWSGPGEIIEGDNFHFLDSYDKLIANLLPGADHREIARLRADNRSVLDFIASDLGAARARLGVAGTKRLEQHLSSIRGLEHRLNEASQRARHSDFQSAIELDQFFDLYFRLAAVAFGADLTRVITMSNFVGDSTYYGGEVGDDVHREYAHKSAGPFPDAYSVARTVAVQTRDATNVARIIQHLKDAGLLESTLVMWTMEMADGNHGNFPWPVVMAGGSLDGGQLLRMPGRVPFHDLLTTVAHALGMSVGRNYGDPRYSTGPLRCVNAHAS